MGKRGRRRVGRRRRRGRRGEGVAPASLSRPSLHPPYNRITLITTLFHTYRFATEGAIVATIAHF